MNITIDTSALIAVITGEPKKSRIIELTIGANLISPHSVHWEVGNVFSAMLKQPHQLIASTSLYRRVSTNPD
jgi:hypothetical protein